MNLSNFIAADRYQRRKLFALLGVALLAVTALMSYLIWSGYRDTKRSAETTSFNYAAIIEARLDATLRRVDAILNERVRTLPIAALSQQTVPRYAREINAMLDSHMVNFPELTGIRIYDADGDLLYTTDRKTTPRVNVIDRNFFRRARDGRQDSLTFSEVVIGRPAGRQVLVVVRALWDGQGAFRGIVNAAVDLDYFQKLFQSLDLGAHGIVVIRRSDDFTQVVRWPPLDNETNKALSLNTPIRQAITAGKKEGTTDFTVNVDGVPRLLSFHKLERYPFFVVSALAREDVLAGWTERTLGAGLSGLLLLGLVVGLLFRLWRAEIRQAQVIAELGESEARFRALFEHAEVGVAQIESVTGRIMRANRKYAQILGYSPQEIIQMGFHSVMHADDLPATEAQMKHLNAGELREHSTEKRYVRKDGVIIWVNLTISPMWKPGEAPTHYIAVARDIGTFFSRTHFGNLRQ